MISIVILIENGGSGGTFATPIAQKIYRHYFGSESFSLVNK